MAAAQSPSPEETEIGAQEARLPPMSQAAQASQAEDRATSLAFDGSTPRTPSRGTSPEQDVWLHIYHCDSFTGFLNRVALKQAEIPIYHAGVEVYGEEWCFQYFEDTWDNPAISGVMRCYPKMMMDYDYQESINLGPTQLSYDEVEEVLHRLHNQWPACSYHITRNNCLTFAESLCRMLKAPRAFPSRLKGILEASHNNRSADAMVEYSWSWAKWWMRRKHRQDEDPSQHRDAAGRGGLWAVVAGGPTLTCSGLLCPGAPKKSVSEGESCMERGLEHPPADSSLVRAG